MEDKQMRYLNKMEQTRYLYWSMFQLIFQSVLSSETIVEYSNKDISEFGAMLYSIEDAVTGRATHPALTVVSR